MHRPRQSENIEKMDTSPEAIERGARRRRQRERDLDAEQRKIKAERARVLHSLLHHRGSAGLLVVESVPEDAETAFMEAFEVELEDKLLVLPAHGNIQGQAVDEETAAENIRIMEAHAERHAAKGVLGFAGVDFKGQSGAGTPQVATHVSELLQASTQSPREGLAVVAFGHGEFEDMPSSPYYDHKLERGIVSQLQAILGLDRHGEPHTVLTPRLMPQANFTPRVNASVKRLQNPGPADAGPGMGFGVLPTD